MRPDSYPSPKMRVAILLNRSWSRVRILGKAALSVGYDLLRGDLEIGRPFILPEYDSFARLLDPSPLILGTDEEINWKELQDCQLLIWEWGWTSGPPETAMKIKRKVGLPLLTFPGPVDRFWREMRSQDIDIQFEASQATDLIGVMLKDLIPSYRALSPQAHVFHMPVPIDVERLSSFAVPDERRNHKLILLTAPTRLTGSASQLPIMTLLAFRNAQESRPELEGICFTYSDEEHAEARRVLHRLGMESRVRLQAFLRPIHRYLHVIGKCYAGMYLPNALTQGRTALIAACMGIPMVVNEEIETHRTLYPRTVVRWCDVDGAAALLLRLLEDQSFYATVQTEARDRVAYYSADLCRERILDGLAEAAKRGAGAR